MQDFDELILLIIRNSLLFEKVSFSSVVCYTNKVLVCAFLEVLMSGPFYKDVDISSAYADAGLRAHMLRVYNYMGCGLAVTGVVAYFASTSAQLMSVLFENPIVSLLLMLSPLIMVFALSWRISKIESSTANVLFWIFASLMGLSLSSVFLIYTGASIVTTFFVTSSMFLSMSIYGYITDTDLSKMGSIMIMGLIGVIVASLINLFMRNSMFEFVISIIGVVIFTGLTAYDTQNIKNMYLESDSVEIANKKAIVGALSLYLNFINLFLHILRFLGVRRD